MSRSLLTILKNAEFKCGEPFETVANECICPSGYEEDKEGYCFIEITVIKSPLKQLQVGIEPKDVKCKVGFQLILDITHDRPACVENNSVAKLVERGWVSSQK